MAGGSMLQEGSPIVGDSAAVLYKYFLDAVVLDAEPPPGVPEE